MLKKEVKISELRTHIARAILRTPDINPKNSKVYAQEVVFTIRPGWSNVNKYETALPGGKIEVEEDDFYRIIQKEESQNPHFVLMLDQMVQAGLNAAEREVLQELGVLLPTGLLKFVEVTTNKAGWTTWAYAGDLEEKPTVQVNPESAGTRWIDTNTLVNGKPQLLSGHLGITRRALQQLDKNSAK